MDCPETTSSCRLLLNSACVIYKGSVLNVLGILPGENTQVIFEEIDNTLEEIIEAIANVSVNNHVLATNTGLGEKHTISGANIGDVLTADSSTTARFRELLHSEINDDEETKHRIINDITPSISALYSSQKIEDRINSSSGAVDSVFGRINEVIAESNDYTWNQIDKTISNIADITSKSHTSLTDKGANTHAIIDIHLVNKANPHEITATQIPDFDLEVTTNTDVVNNTIHRTSTGTDHTYINQSVTTTATPTFVAIDFDITLDNPVYQEGRLFYDKTKKALSYYNDELDITVNLGQEFLIPVFNNSGFDIPNGKVVYPSGVDVVSGKVTIGLADSRFKNNSRLVGMVTHSIENNTSGYVTRLGEVGDLNTTGLSGILFLSTEGNYSMDKPTNGAYIIAIGAVSKQDSSYGTIVIDPSISELTVEITDTNGFTPEQRTGTTLSFTDNTPDRTFKIEPNDIIFHYYILGDKYEKHNSESVVIEDTTGLHVIYYDDELLVSVLNPSDGILDNIIRTKAIVAYVYWNAEDAQHYFLGDERHGISMSPDTHAYLHFTRGVQYLSGLAVTDIDIGTGASNTNAQFGTSTGHMTDEDLFHTLLDVTSTTGLSFYYREGANGYYTTGTNITYSFPIGATPLPQYNEFTGTTYQLTEITSGNYMLLHIFATNDISKKPICVIGNTQYSTVGTASIGAESEIVDILGNFPSPEFLPLATIIIEGKTSFTNDVNTRIVQTIEGIDYKDWRTSELKSGTTPTNHNNLTGLDLANTTVTWGHINDQAQTLYGIKTFNTLPQSSATPNLAADFVTKAYGDANYIGIGGVTSFNTRTGAVIPVADDYTAGMVTDAFDKTNDDLGAINDSAVYIKYIPDERTKLAGIEELAEVNNMSDINVTGLTNSSNTTLHYHTVDRDRTNHTGTQLSTTISDFEAAVLAFSTGESASYVSDYGLVGLINGINTVFTTSVDFKTGTTKIYLNGVRQFLITDYTETGSNEITFVIPPTSGDLIIAEFWYITATTLFKATATELDTGTDDVKYTTAKAIKDSHNVPNVVPSTVGNVLTSDGTDWISSASSGGGEFSDGGDIASANRSLGNNDLLYSLALRTGNTDRIVIDKAGNTTTNGNLTLNGTTPVLTLSDGASVLDKLVIYQTGVTSYIRNYRPTSGVIALRGVSGTLLELRDDGTAEFNGVVTATLASESIDKTQLANKYKGSSAIAVLDIDFDASHTYIKTLTTNSTFTLSNLYVGVKSLLLSGDFTLALPTWLGDPIGTYDGTVNNYIDIEVYNATGGSEDGIWVIRKKP